MNGFLRREGTIDDDAGSGDGRVAPDKPEAAKESASLLTRRDGEPWVHLLVQQDIPDPPASADLSAVRFHVEAKYSRSLADYRIAGLNLGWEVPGIFDVAMQVRNLSSGIGMKHE